VEKRKVETTNGTEEEVETMRRPLCYHGLGTNQESDVVLVDFSDEHPTWS